MSVRQLPSVMSAQTQVVDEFTPGDRKSDCLIRRDDGRIITP